MNETLGYRELVFSLPFLSDMGVLEDGSLPAMLVVSHLMNRGNVLSSGMKSAELEEALSLYKRSAHGRPIASVEGAILEAVQTARHEEWSLLAQAA